MSGVQIADGIETGRDYFWRRSDGWQWFDGEERWWEYFVEFSGFNGAGGVWIVEKSRWNSRHDGFMFESIRTLSREDSVALIKDVQRNQNCNGGQQ